MASGAIRLLIFGGVYYLFRNIPGGDSEAVQGSLHNVQQLQATGSAFAAITLDGSVVAWGDSELGGLYDD